MHCFLQHDGEIDIQNINRESPIKAIFGFQFLDFGNTPGHYASEGGKPECLNCFLQHDGEIDIQNIKGDSPLDTARKFGHPLLMEKGGMVV